VVALVIGCWWRVGVSLVVVGLWLSVAVLARVGACWLVVVVVVVVVCGCGVWWLLVVRPSSSWFVSLRFFSFCFLWASAHMIVKKKSPEEG
jgi:hypothetical protein